MSHLGHYASPEKTSISNDACETEIAGSCAALRNDAGTLCAGWHKIDTTHSRNVLVPEKENPGALAGATEAACEVGNFKTEEYRERAVSSTRLCAAIAECHPDDAILILSAALQDMAAGAPLPVWLSALDEARWWASCATQFELKAWCLASFEAMHPKARARFLAYAARGVVQ